MTREEAIEVLENGEWWEELTEWYMVAHPEHDKLHDAVDMAISALRQQEHFREVTKKVDPLTLDELRKMYDGEEGAVWVKNGQACFPAILDIYDGELVAVWSAEPDYFEERHYGKNWLAYRQKPEEGTV